jgi:thiol:disulfide interchange protein DsbA
MLFGGLSPHRARLVYFSAPKFAPLEIPSSEVCMPRFVTVLLSTLLIVLVPAAHAAQSWVEGKHYVRLPSPQHTNVAPGKVEVLEVFSYGCPACNHFQPVMERLRHELPANAQLNFLPAAFNTAEDWPMLQRAYFTAQSLGVADRTHQGVFDAVWKNGDLAVVDPSSNRLKNPLPSIEDAAQFYKKAAGVSPDKFLEVARSFGVEMKIRAANSQIQTMEIPSTPSIVVNGKYRVIMDSLNSNDEIIDVVRYLVSLESAH